MTEEFLLTVDSDANTGSATVWRAQSGSRVTSARGGAMARGSVALLGGGTLLAGEKGRPALGAWPLSPSDQCQRRHLLTGPVTAVATDPTGVWCAVAMSERVAIHHAASGRQVALLARHYQPVTCLAFSDDGAALVTAGDDALVMVWLLASCVDTDTAGPVGERGGEPLHVWSDHALPVRALCVSGGSAVHARVFSVSADGTCRVYRLSSGQQLLVVTAAAVEGATCFTAVAVGCGEHWLYLGTDNGRIHRLSLREPPRTLTAPAAGGQDDPQFVGHTGPVRGLSVAARAPLLASASEDGCVRVWRLDNGQCCHCLTMTGTPLAVLFFTAPASMLAPGGAAPGLRLAPLQRQPPVPGAAVELDVRLRDLSDSEEEGDCSDSQRYLYDKLAQSQRVNASLYHFMVENISNGVFVTSDTGCQ